MKTPEGWTRTRLGGILSLEYGKSLPASARTNGPYPVLGSNGVVGHHSSSAVGGPGIVVGRKGTAGSTNWSDKDFWPIDTTYFVQVRQAVDIRWAYYLLSHCRLETLNQATGIPGLNRNDAYVLEVLLPPLHEQKKIAEVLGSVDEAIRATKALIEQTRRVKQGLLQQLLTRGIGHTRFKMTEIGEIPESWEVVRVHEVILGIDAGISPSCPSHPPLPGHWGVLKVSSVTTEVFRELESKECPPDVPGRLDLLVRKGDVLMARANGVADLVGRAAMVTDSPSRMVMLSDKTLRLNPNIHRVLPEFLWAFLRSNRCRQQIAKAWGGGSGQKNISQKHIRELIMPLPSVSEQQSIAEILGSVDEDIQRESESVYRMQTIMLGLSGVLLSGQSRVAV